MGTFQYIKGTVFFTVTIFLSACFSQPKDKNGNLPDKTKSAAADRKFDFTKPSAKWILPDELYEVSGIVITGKNTALALEDMHPVIYMLKLDTLKATITGTLPFYKTAKEKFDMEDLAMIGDTLYALWSHGSIFKIKDWQHVKTITETQTSLSKDNNTEGIAYDPVTGNLLIACKNESGIESEKKSSRSIYEFDVKADTLKTKPFLVISKKMLQSPDGEKIRFFPSAVAVDPVSHDVYVISTRDVKCIAQFSHEGVFKSFHYLDRNLLPQPEGLSFDAEGNLYISSEGKHGLPACICQFR